MGSPVVDWSCDRNDAFGLNFLLAKLSRKGGWIHRKLAQGCSGGGNG
jgi:hypothetical protein